MSKKAVKTEYSVFSRKIKSPVRLALLSDIHERRADDILAMLRRSKPDIIAVSGDTFERYGDDGKLPCRKSDLNLFHRALLTVSFNINRFLLFAAGGKNTHNTQNAYDILSAAANLAPVYLSLGNHERELEDEDIAFLKEKNIHLLDNSDVVTDIKGEKLIVGGLSSEADEEWIERFSKRDGFKLLLCHHPEYYDLYVRDREIDLTLSGHNHGGQIRIFGKGVLSSRSGLFPKYDCGFFDGRLVVSAGCSNPVAIPRLGNPRELVIIELKPEKVIHGG